MIYNSIFVQVADVVYPIALKYDNRLGDAFWVSLIKKLMKTHKLNLSNIDKVTLIF